jgi:hypothetical protein
MLAAAPSPFAKHDASCSKVLRLLVAAFQIRKTSSNLSRGNCGQDGTRLVSHGWPALRPCEFYLILRAVAKDSIRASFLPVSIPVIL